jgi:DNA-binding LytR/AlgR family response regulator
LKINIDRSDEYNEIEITIKCRTIDEKLEKVISNIRLYNKSISGKKNGSVYFLDPEDVFYIDTVDERVFIYTKDSMYETSLKLYEIEEQLMGSSIIRVNKSMILNLMKISHITPLLNGRMAAALENGEKVVVTRQYVPAFKRKLGL